MRLYNPTKRQLDKWRAWIDSRPPIVKDLAERFDPWTLYRMECANQYVTLCGIFEGGTLCVSVDFKHNKRIAFERNVFGVLPDDLEPMETHD